ncbi:MAG TPA: ATP-binding cassette domain-containing protein, partial [Ktedonobacteraceae bacterium]|nr:ATP-binding cassette domain-containing protein [Ktedonobacteraceae bacterium]
DKGHFVLDDEIYVDTKQHIDVPPQERPIGFVFQDYVLFPHLSVFDNVAFGLRMQGTHKKEMRQRVGEALEQVHLVGYDERRPKQLSGGQQQRVAIARALAMKPQLLLLDESLSALDIQTRREVEQELRQILSRLQLTTVMVSHQYIDALLFGNQIIVLDNGKVIQQGKHLDLLLHPQSSYIAEMVGVNLFKGRVVSTDASMLHTIALSNGNEKGLEVIAISQEDPHTTLLTPQQEVSVVVDPRSITLHQSKPESSARNVFAGQIIQIVPVSAAFSEADKKMEGLMRVSMSIDPSLPPLTADITVSSSNQMDLSPGKEIYASFKASETRAYL